jgi:[acyl-carrier-protein] S-malonyltransferase
VFQEVDDALGQKLFQLMTEGPEDRPVADRKCPASDHGACHRGAARAGKGRRRPLSDKADFVAGHSLGEYTALCARARWTLSTTARLLKTARAAMQAAVPVGVGAMAALLGADMATGAGDRRCRRRGRGVHRRQRQ